MRFLWPAVIFALAGGCVPNEAVEKAKKERAAKAAPPAKAASARRAVRPPNLTRKPRTAAAAAKTETPRDPDPMLEGPFSDDFERTELGDAWYATSPRWRIERGRLCVRGARNHPAWLRRRLPVNARIEFDAESSSDDGDIKAEIWGDGRSHAKTVSYNKATSYLTIFGGWKNRFHVLARIDEHAPDRPEIKIDEKSDDIRARPVAAGQSYHFKIERNDGKTVRWYVDDIEILTYPDPDPLEGPGHEHFGFNDWDVRVCFDNLRITPLE